MPERNRGSYGQGEGGSDRGGSGRSSSGRSSSGHSGSGRSGSGERGASPRGGASRGDGAYRGTSNSGGEPRGFRARSERSESGRPEGGGYRRNDNEFRPARDVERRSQGSDSPRSASRPQGSERPYRGDRPSSDRRGQRPEGDQRPQRDGGNRDRRRPDERQERQERPRNAADLRSSNRPDREPSPEIDQDVTGAELDRVIKAQLRVLEAKSGEWVAKHLVMAGRLVDVEPELAFQHALAASRRAGRLAAVREAVGLTAYAAGHFGEALREFRTFRRISGSNIHLPVMADCERGLGRPDRALDMARSDEARELDVNGQVDMAIVVSGARMDLGQFDAAVSALEIPLLDRNRAYSYSPRLFRAYADALEEAGRGADAQEWRSLADKAENALGIGDFAEPEILDLADDDDEPDSSGEAGRAKRRERSDG